jgi:hypothetical protein
MNAITQSKATRQTARGWEKNDPDATGGWLVLVGVAGHGLPLGQGREFYIGNL